MNTAQKKAAASLHRALKKCAAAELGVYAFESSIFVCPQPGGREHPGWDDAPMRVCDEIGNCLYVKDLDATGGGGC